MKTHGPRDAQGRPTMTSEQFARAVAFWKRHILATGGLDTPAGRFRLPVRLAKGRPCS